MIDTRTLEKNTNAKGGAEVSLLIKRACLLDADSNAKYTLPDVNGRRQVADAHGKPYDLTLASKTVAELEQTYIFVSAFENDDNDFRRISLVIDTPDELEAIKKMGAIWDAQAKVWLAPNGIIQSNISGVDLIKMTELSAGLVAQYDTGFNPEAEEGGKPNPHPYFPKLIAMIKPNLDIDSELPIYAYAQKAMRIMTKIQLAYIARYDFVEKYEARQVNWLDGNETGKAELIAFLRDNLREPVAEADLPRLASEMVTDYLGK